MDSKEAVEKLRKIKTSSARELMNVKIPKEVTALINSKDQELLWNGGIFTLPREMKTKLYEMCGNPKAYYKAKLVVFKFFFFPTETLL
jgi:hypothetical protein